MNQKKQVTQKGMKTFLLLMLVVVLLLVSRVFVRKAYRSTYKTPEKAVKATEWMKDVKDDTPLNLINIPGAHDCATNYVQYPLFAQCQYLSIEEQLNRGIRFLDVRLAMDEKNENSLYLVHSFAKCKVKGGISADTYQFDSLLTSCYEFLKKNPSETIVMNLKQDYGGINTVEFQKRIYTYVDRDSEFWYLKNEMPKISDVRGKIVLCHRYDDEAKLGDERSGLDLSWVDMPGAYTEGDSAYHEETLTWGGKLLVQDHYEYDVKHKNEIIKKAYEQANAIPAEERKNTVFLNFLSTKGTDFAVGTPYSAASKINPVFLKMEKKGLDWLGWTILDYCDEELARAIFETNLTL